VTAETSEGLLIAGGSDGTQSRREVWRLTPSLERVRVGELKDGVVLAAGGLVSDSLLILGGCARAL